MERSSIITLILLCIPTYDFGFSIGEWFEIDGCHSLGAATTHNQTSLSANEPGDCLQWCRTKTVALQNSACLCINDDQTLTRNREDYCSQNCSGDENLKCGGNSSNLVSVYRERRNTSVEWRSINGSGCLTYSYNHNEIGFKLVPDNCTVKHPFFCYSETKFVVRDCYTQADISNKRTWYEALESCRSVYPLILWPAQNANNCIVNYIQEGMFWVAVYQWTKVLPTSTPSVLPTSTTSLTTTTTSVATSMTSATLSTITMTNSTTSTTPMTSSTLPTSETSPKSTTSTTSMTSSTFPTFRTSPTTTATTSNTSTTSSPSTSTSSPTTVPNTSINLTFNDSQGSSTSKGEPTRTSLTVLTNSSSISMTTFTSSSTKSTPTPGSPTSTNVNRPSGSEASSFKIDPPNVGLGVGIGLLVGFLISITIAYCRMRMCSSDGLSDVQLGGRAFDQNVYSSTPSNTEMKAIENIDDYRETSNNSNHMSDFQLGARTFHGHMYVPSPLNHEGKGNGNIDTSRDHEKAEEKDADFITVAL